MIICRVVFLHIHVAPKAHVERTTPVAHKMAVDEIKGIVRGGWVDLPHLGGVSRLSANPRCE